MALTGQGSSGAGDSGGWRGYMDEKGCDRPVYVVRSLYDQLVAGYDLENSGPDAQWSQDCELHLITNREGGFYRCKANGAEDPEEPAAFVESLEEKPAQIGQCAGTYCTGLSTQRR